jgi:hypothetical protein
MSSDAPGRLVTVTTKFQKEAVRPGGIGRSNAHMASDRSIASMKAEVEQQIGTALTPLIALLRDWQPEHAARACELAALTRDLAGLADRHLLTEVAMHTFDCLDAVLIDKAPMSGEEAACYADALQFARQDLCRGRDLAPYAPLLKDLERLTTLVISRGAQAVA